MTNYFEGLEPGQRFETASRLLTEADIVDFAATWDPQGFHLDNDAGSRSLFGALAASGLHTLLVSFRLCIDARIFTPAAVAGLELQHVKFIRPVFPRDCLQVTLSVVKKRASQSKPHLGIVWWHLETRSQTGELVLSMDFSNLLMKRPAAA
jgi:acyl dehydratase